MDKITKYESIIKVQLGVLYLKSKPGMGKTAILNYIAEKNNWVYMDRRLSQKDSTEIIGLPKSKFDKESNCEVMYYAYPQYLVEANKKPTLIVFEELNRATLETRNAALQILLERRVEDLHLNKNVFIAATGNLGEEDGTEVEEFDTALNNRLIHIEHELTINEWKTYFANKNVNHYIIQFIENNPSYFHRLPTSDDNKYPAYPTPRSYTFLSDFIGKDTSPKDMLPLIKEVGHGYIGVAVTKLIRYLEDIMVLNINDIIDRFDQVKDQLKKVNRDKISELLGELKDIKLYEYKKDKLNNVKEFLKLVDPDERVGFLSELLYKFNKNEMKKNKDFTEFLMFFEKDYQEIDKNIN